jgi:hypothetical protein
LQFPFESTVIRLGTGRRPRPFKTVQMANLRGNERGLRDCILSAKKFKGVRREKA